MNYLFSQVIHSIFIIWHLCARKRIVMVRIAISCVNLPHTNFTTNYMGLSLGSLAHSVAFV